MGGFWKKFSLTKNDIHERNLFSLLAFECQIVQIFGAATVVSSTRV